MPFENHILCMSKDQEQEESEQVIMQSTLIDSDQLGNDLTTTLIRTEPNKKAILANGHLNITLIYYTDIFFNMYLICPEEM